MKILQIKIGDAWHHIQALVGPSAYDIAVKNGFEGTEEEWLISLKPTIEINSETDTMALNQSGKIEDDTLVL